MGHLTLVGLLSCVTPQVRNEFVPSIKWLQTPLAVLPMAEILVHREGVVAVKMGDEPCQAGKL